MYNRFKNYKLIIYYNENAEKLSGWNLIVEYETNNLLFDKNIKI